MDFIDPNYVISPLEVMETKSSITFSFLSVDSFDKTIFSQTNVDNVISAAQIAENYIQANGSQLVTDVSDKFTRFRNLSFTLDYLYK